MEKDIYDIYDSRLDDAMEYAESGQYEIAIHHLLPLALEGNETAMNNLAVTYQRTGRYKNAYKWYKKANMMISKENILALYYNQQIPFNYEEYRLYCNELIDQDDEGGYFYLSKLYMDNKFGLVDKKFAYLTVLEGLSKSFENSKGDRLKFLYAYFLNDGIGCEIDYTKSNKIYRNLAKHSTYDNLLTNVCRHNYGLQLLDGRGCEENIDEAIGFLSVAAFDGYRPSIKILIEIYSDYETRKDLLAALVWKTILNEKNFTKKLEEKYRELFINSLDFKGMYTG